MRTVKINVYTIVDHPNPEKCFEWIRDNWHDLNDHSVNEFVNSLEELQKKIGGSLDYAISAFPDRGEFIKLKGYDKDALHQLDENECPLTGFIWDYDIIKALKDGNLKAALKSLHADTEYIYSDKGLLEFCEANEYEFLESGKQY